MKGIVAMKRLVIIGNGFDLGHGLKTRFSDFIGSNKEYPKKYKRFKGQYKEPNWNNIEDNFKNLLIKTMEDRDTFFLSEELENKIDEYVLDDTEDINYFTPNKSDYFNGEFNKILNDVNLLNDFEHNFLIYMNKECNPLSLRKLKPAKKITEILKDTNLVISFNYTKLVEEVYRFDNVVHIHGVLENKDIFIGTSCEDLMLLLVNVFNIQHDKICIFHQLFPFLMPWSFFCVRIAAGIKSCVDSLFPGFLKKLSEEIDL